MVDDEEEYKTGVDAIEVEEDAVLFQELDIVLVHDDGLVVDFWV